MNIKHLLTLLGAVCILGYNVTYAGPVKKRGEPRTNAIKYIDKSNMDLTLKPGDNFYLYANGNWIKKNPVPASKTRWGSFDVLHEESTQRLRTLLEEAEAHTSKDKATQMIGDFYASGMDSIGIEARGIEPIKVDLDRIAALQDVQGVIDETAVLRTTGVGSPFFGLGVTRDRKKADQYIPQIGQGGISLPDRDYYLKDDARSGKVRTAYKNYIIALFELAGKNTVTGIIFLSNQK